MRITDKGEQWDTLTPRGRISWLIDRVCVSATDDDVESDIRRRCRDSTMAFPQHIEEESVKFALLCHAENRKLYSDVMYGEI